MSETILVTGGAGYIGSHACVELLDKGYHVVVIDNLSNSKVEALERVQKITGKPLDFVQGDILDHEVLQKVFAQYHPVAVIHFAGLKAVGESVEKPLLYYRNNVTGTATLLDVMVEAGVRNIVFSSSCTVYGAPESLPIREDSPLQAVNPYGQTKLTIEYMLKDLAAADPTWNVSILRYFNPVGAHPSGEIGEDPLGIPNNLMPYITKVAVGELNELSVWGNNYPTPDGTCIRDYIHVVDLAKGHIKALQKLDKKPGVIVHNLGTGQGYSVLEVIEGFRKATGRAVAHRIANRRAGDAPAVYADPSLAAAELPWKAELGIEAMCAERLALATEEPERLLNTRDHIIDQFVCQALRGEPALWDELPSDTDGESVNERCLHHGVQSLLYHAMYLRPEWPGWPQYLRQKLEAASKAGIAQDMMRFHFLQETSNSLNRERIPFLVIKGEALARTHYPIPGTRTRCDTDLFIPIEAIEPVKQCLINAGFVIVSPVYKCHQFTVRRMESSDDAIEFDIHWRILNSPRFARTLPFDEVYAKSIQLAGAEEIRTLSLVHSLLLACMHREGSNWHDKGKLIWIHDIHVLASSLSAGEGDSFADTAIGHCVQSCCRESLVIAEACFATHLSNRIMDLLSEPEPRLTLARRYKQSNLRLLMQDFFELPDQRARNALAVELFSPSRESLLRKYNKNSRGWLPWLYLRQVVGGLAQRLMLK